MGEKTDVITDPHEVKLIADPIKYQMWHHSFDPNKDVPEVSKAELKAPPQVMRGPTISEFLAKTSSITASIVQDALNKKPTQQATLPQEES